MDNPPALTDEKQFAPWGWYAGMDESDVEMTHCNSRADAILCGQGWGYPDGFYICEGRMTLDDWDKLDGVQLENAPFAETRNAEWFPSQAMLSERNRRGGDDDA